MAGGSGRHHRGRRPRAGAVDQRGFTLVEIQITILLLGLVVTAFLSALSLVQVVSDTERRTALAEAEARHIVERVRALPYDRCGLTGVYTASLDADTDTDVTATLTTAVSTGSSGGSLTWVAMTDPASPCHGVTTESDAFVADPGLQQVTVSVTVAGTPSLSSQPVTLVKRLDNS